MTREEKNLLLKDLCARLPYGVKLQIKNEIIVLNSICNDDSYHFNFIGDDKEGVNNEQIKPYLFPYSDISEKHEFLSTCNCYCSYYWTEETFDWFNENHIDYRGLIEKNLAIDATGLNIY